MYQPKPLKDGRLFKHGPTHGSWKGGRYPDPQGYIVVADFNHPRATKRGRIYEHILVAERAIGHLLPAGAEVHHVNGNRGDNRPSNLVICPDHAYHVLLHRRQRALEATGDPTQRKCGYCGKYGVEAAMRYTGSRGSYRHRECDSAKSSERGRRKRRLAREAAAAARARGGRG